MVWCGVVCCGGLSHQLLPAMMLRTPPPKRPPSIPSPQSSPDASASPLPPDSDSLSSTRPCILHAASDSPRLTLPPVRNDGAVFSDLSGAAFIEDEIRQCDLDWDSARFCYKGRQMGKSEVLEVLNGQEMLIGELESKVSSLESRTNAAESEAKRLQSHIDSLEQEVAGTNGREKDSQTQLLQELERMEKRLHAQLDCYSELEIKLQEEIQRRVAAEEKANTVENQLEMFKEIKEKAAEAFTREIFLLKQELERSHKDSGLNVSRLKAENADEKRVQAVQAEVRALEAQYEGLQKPLSEPGCEDYDPSTTRVLHMVQNLDADVKREDLQFEARSLHGTSVLHEKQKSNSAGRSDPWKEVVLLKEQVSLLEKRESRYKRVFAEKISVFRRACCLLFGYEIHMIEEQHSSSGIPITLLTLHSTYAHNEGDKLEFQYESGRMILLANGYTSCPEVARMVEVFLQNLNSIPAFTANLTVELFNQISMC